MIGVVPLLLIKLNMTTSKKIKMILFLTILYFLWLTNTNNSRVAFLGLSLEIVVYLCLNLIFKIKQKKIMIPLTAIIIITVLFTIIKVNPNISIGKYDLSLNELLLDPINRVIMLNDYKTLNAGSILNRVNAAIYGVRALIKSNFLGIGIGNTIVLLEQPGTTLVSAKSLHNYPIQFLAENGLIALVIYMTIIFIFLKKLFSNNKNKIIKVGKLTGMIGIPFGMISSSTGIHSNYMFWTALFILIQLKETDKL